MKRILIMVAYNLIFVPYWWWQLCHYARHTDEIPEEKKYALLKKIVLHANRGGRVIIKSSGQEHLPKENGFVFFPNHQGLYDVLALIEACPRPFSVVNKKEVQDNFFLKRVFAIMKAFSIDREDVRQSLKVIMSVTEEVKKGRNYLIFPEGTRSKRGNEMLDFKGGSFKAAMNAKCPIVPVAMIDSFKPFDTNSIEKTTVQVHFLEPLHYEEYQGMKSTEIAAEVRRRIEEVIGEKTKE